MNKILFEQRDKVEQALTDLEHIDNLFSILHNEFYDELVSANRLIPYEKCFVSVLDSIMNYIIESKKALNVLFEELSVQIKKPSEAGTSDGNKEI